MTHQGMGVAKVATAPGIDARLHSMGHRNRWRAKWFSRSHC